MPEANSNSIFATPFTDKEVIEEINRLKGKKYIGYYDIPVNNFISCKNILAKPLVRLFNMSIDKGKFPSILKVARVLPVYQNDVKHIETIIDQLIF